MGLQVNKVTTSADSDISGNIASGLIIDFMSIFPTADGSEVHCNLKNYRNATAKSDGKSTIMVTEIPNMGIVIPLTDADKVVMTAAITLIHTKLKDILEALPGIGVGKISII